MRKAVAAIRPKIPSRRYLVKADGQRRLSEYEHYPAATLVVMGSKEVGALILALAVVYRFSLRKRIDVPDPETGIDPSVCTRYLCFWLMAIAYARRHNAYIFYVNKWIILRWKDYGLADMRTVEVEAGYAC